MTNSRINQIIQKKSTEHLNSYLQHGKNEYGQKVTASFLMKQNAKKLNKLEQVKSVPKNSGNTTQKTLKQFNKELIENKKKYEEENLKEKSAEKINKRIN